MSRYRERKGTYKVKEVGDIRPLKSERNKDKEDALNAKIAAIREANKIIERRHREVEADRLEAERNNASVTLVLKKRSKNNSMSSNTDSEIAELNIPPEGKAGYYQQMEKNDKEIEKVEWKEDQTDEENIKITIAGGDNEVKTDQVKKTRNDGLVAPKIEKDANSNLIFDNPVSETTGFDNSPESEEGHNKEKEAGDAKTEKAEYNRKEDAVGAETFANNSIDYEIAQLKLAIETEINKLRGAMSKKPQPNKTEVPIKLQNKEKNTTTDAQLPKLPTVELEMESVPSGQNSCDNCFRRHKAKLIIEQAALLADW